MIGIDIKMPGSCRNCIFAEEDISVNPLFYSVYRCKLQITPDGEGYASSLYKSFVGVVDKKDCPLVEARENTKGEWIEEEDDFFTNYRCSACGEVFCSEDIGISIESIYHFCPNCGADLRESEE